MSSGLIWYKTQPESSAASYIDNTFYPLFGQTVSHDVTAHAKNLAPIMKRIFERSNTIIIVCGPNGLQGKDNIVVLLSHILSMPLDKKSRSKFYCDTVRGIKLPSLAYSILFPSCGGSEGIMLRSGSQTIIVIPSDPKYAMTVTASMGRFLSAKNSVRRAANRTATSTAAPYRRIATEPTIKTVRQNTRIYSEEDLRHKMENAVIEKRRMKGLTSDNVRDFNRGEVFDRSRKNQDAAYFYLKSKKRKISHAVAITVITFGLGLALAVGNSMDIATFAAENTSSDIIDTSLDYITSELNDKSTTSKAQMETVSASAQSILITTDSDVVTTPTSAPTSSTTTPKSSATAAKTSATTKKTSVSTTSKKTTAKSTTSTSIANDSPTTQTSTSADVESAPTSVNNVSSTSDNSNSLTETSTSQKSVTASTTEASTTTTAKTTTTTTKTVTTPTMRIKSGGSIKTGSAVDILASIAEAEMGSDYNLEALKAQVVAAYTFYLYSGGADKAPSFPTKTPGMRALTAARAVAGQKMTYNGKIPYTPYYAISAGKTAANSTINVASLAYLKPVDCSVDKDAKGYKTVKSYSAAQVAKKVKDATGIDLTSTPKSNWFNVTSRDVNGLYVEKISIGGKSYKGSKAWLSIFGYSYVRSACFYINYNTSSDTFTFTSYGYGHGVGMSQKGANAYAAQGKNYKWILQHFYSGVSIG